MKKIIYLILPLSLLLASACSDDAKDKILEGEPQVSLSSWNLTFSSDGGQETIAVSYNRPTLTFSETPEWLGLEQQGNKVTFTASENDGNGIRSAMVYTTTGSGADIARDSVYVLQLPFEITDLSADGTANCYIAPTGGSYRFDASVKGNGNRDGDGNSTYLDLYGYENSGIVYADLLWETTYDGDRSRSSRIIEQLPALSPDGYVSFSTGDTEGNALIAVQSASGDIIWSWHIWVTDNEIISSVGNGYTWMDRNLGALNNTPGDARNRGMFYQWGRKDPMLPTTMDYEDAALWASQTWNSQVGKGSGSWVHTGVYTPRIAEPPGNLRFTVRNPMTFLIAYGGIGSTISDWYVVAPGARDQYTSGLWADTKTIFDPCPVGYMVPPRDAWLNPELEEVRLTSDWEFAEYGVSWKNGSGDYYPYAGYYEYSSGTVLGTGNVGSFWTTSMIDSNPRSERLRTSENSVGFGNLGRTHALNVRCIAEK